MPRPPRDNVADERAWKWYNLALTYDALADVLGVTREQVRGMVMHGLRQARANREPLGRYDRWVRDWERDGVIPWRGWRPDDAPPDQIH
jgi:hypothetical protein